MPTQADLLRRYQAVMANAFGQPQAVLARGQGVHLYDADGKQYLDLLSGIAVNILGHNHPTVAQVIARQAGTLGHISNLYASEHQIRLAERLTGYAGGGRVFFTNSGTEANEAAFKISRLTKRSKIVAMEGSFHGRTMGSLAVTHTAAYREPFEPLPGQVSFVPYGDESALAAAVDESTAAVVLEVIQGESGVLPAPEGYVAAAREITEAAGALLWIDEVQTGMGRSGEILLHRRSGITADLVTLAKGLGAGFPIGACIALGRASDLLTPGAHGSTFAGNPLGTAVGNAVLDVLEGGVLDNGRQVGAWLATQLQLPGVKSVRGAGMLLGVVLNQPVAPKVVAIALEEGFLLNAPRPDVIRIAPPLISTREDLIPLIEALPRWLTDV